MNHEFPLLNDSPTISRSFALSEEVVALLKKYHPTLATIHGGGAAFVKRVIDAGEAFCASVGVADKEGAEAIGAAAQSDALIKQGVEHLGFIHDQVRSIAPSLSEADAKALRAAYSLGHRRLSLSRPSDLRALLENAQTAHKSYGPTLTSWGVRQADLDLTADVLSKLPPARDVEVKERNESEAANSKRDAAEKQFYKLANELLRRVLATQKYHEEMTKEFASTINKYAADLRPALPEAD